MKVPTTTLALLLATLAIAAEPAAPEKPAMIEDAMLAAARAGNAQAIDELISKSYKQRGSLDEGAVKAMLDQLVRGEELPAFTVLLERMRRTIYGKDWQPDDALLGELVRDGRAAFLNVVLANCLDPARLEAKRNAAAAAEMSAWVSRRVAEVRKQRADCNALVAAAGNGDLETMRRLLDAGVDVNCIAEKSRHTPLTLATSRNRIEAVRLLLDRGANVDQPKHPGWDYTPLCLTRLVAIAELLKAHGANVRAKLFQRDVSILTYIARWGGADMVEWMLRQGLDPKMIGDNNQNLLFEAGDARTAEILLAAGVDPNHVDEFGKTPLVGAQKGVAQKLIEAGAKLKTDESAISEMIGHFASADSIEAVIKARGKLEPAQAQKALIAAAHSDRAEIVSLLLAHGAKANEPGMWTKDDPMLPLLVCTIFGSEKTAKVLLENGADPNAGEEPGSLLKTAIHNGHREVAKLLRAAGAKGVGDLAFAVAVKDEPTVNALLATAPAFADQPEFWKDALPAAARTGQLKVLRAATADGVPLVSADENAFEAAAPEGQHEALAELLAHWKTPHDPAELRQALWSAVWNSHPYVQQRLAEDFEKCVKLLLDAGAFAPAEASQQSLVEAAVFTRNPGGNPRVIDLLVAAGADPNPTVDSDKPQRLSDRLQAACSQQGCSTPFARTVATIEKHSKITIKR
jgi:ankyrin repeat protein